MLKKGLLVAGMAFSLLACNSNDIEVGNKTKIEVVPEVNVGDVMLGEEVKASFEVKNVGSYPLILAEVKGSCSCTIADYPQDPIQPGETAVIKSVVKTENANTGSLVKDVRITANTDPSLTVVLIKANVKRK